MTRRVWQNKKLGSLTQDEVTALFAEESRRNPKESLGATELKLNLRPQNWAGMFKKGTDLHASEQADYEQRMAAWKERNPEWRKRPQPSS